MSPDFILDLVISGAKPACELWELSPALIRKAVFADLERQFYVWEGARYGIFAQKGRLALPLVLNAADQFKDLPLGENIQRAVNEIRDMTVASAILYSGNQFQSPQYDGDPAYQILVGLLFGYPPCCIRYLIECTRLGKPRHQYEEHHDYHFYLRCEECAKAKRWAPWCGIQ